MGQRLVADLVAVPHPCLGVDGFADGAEEAEGVQRVICRRAGRPT